MDVISLTRELISFNTVNPPGNEEEIAMFTGRILSDNGFNVEYIPYGENRLHLIAEKGITDERSPIILSGHFDTVPPGNIPWSSDPFRGEIRGKKVTGLGSSDMKGALAAMIIASVEVSVNDTPECGIRLIFTADEEPGCIGVKHLINSIKKPRKAAAIIVGEPTANRPAIGHKGAIYLNIQFAGKTAHSSMPERGINAIYKAAGALLRISELKFDTEKDPLLGYPTINVGRISGGKNINSVPDHAEFTIDIRTTTKTDHPKILKKIREVIGKEAVIEQLVDIEAAFTAEDDPFVHHVYNVCEINGKSREFPLALPYLTDGAVLQKFYNNAPTVILGPGQPDMAHKTDEYCYIDELKKSVIIYKNIIQKWRK